MKYISTLFFILLSLAGFSAGDASSESSEKYNPTPYIMHHIQDANEWRLFGNVALPLPVIIYNRDNGELFTGMSNQFKPDSHGEGTVEVGGYAMVHSRIKPVDGSKYIDFSITKNVLTLLLTAALMLFIFTSIARVYKKREGQAPKGLQSFFEPLITFVRDEIAKPNLGDRQILAVFTHCVFLYLDCQHVRTSFSNRKPELNRKYYSDPRLSLVYFFSNKSFGNKILLETLDRSYG